MNERNIYLYLFEMVLFYFVKHILRHILVYKGMFISLFLIKVLTLYIIHIYFNKCTVITKHAIVNENNYLDIKRRQCRLRYLH